MAIGDPLNAGIGVYNPNKNNFAKPPTRGGGLLGSGGLNIKTVPGQSKMDALNAMRERLGMRPLSENSSPAFSIAPTGMTKGQAKQQQMTVGDYDIGRKLAALDRPNTMTQVTSALQDDPGDVFDGSIGDFDITADPFNIETYESTVRDPNLDVDIGAAGLGVEPPAGTEGSTPSTTTTGSKKPNESEAEFNARIEREERGIFDEDTSGAGAVDPKKKTTNPYEQALADAMQSVEESFSGEPKKKKSIEDYKADFAKATGIDVSGKVDKSQALMAFGLALMQNKAGKGFNVGEMLSAVGAAGEKAMPALTAARAEARAGQLAGGKYALQQTATDSANEAALAKEKRQALAKVNENILDFQQKRQLALEKHDMDMLGKNADNRTKVIMEHIKAGGKANEITKPWETTPISGMEKNIVIRKAWSQAQGKDIFVDGDAAAESVAIAYGNVNQAESTIDDLEEIVMQIGTQTGSPALDVLFGRASKLGSALGFGDNIMSKDIKVDGEVIKGVTAESTAKAIQDRMIAQYKRFLTQETGNGISEGDVQRIKDLLGEISVLTVPKEKAMRLQELREIFKTPKKQVASVMSQLADRNNYINDNEHKRALAKLQDATSYQSANLGLKVTESDSGMLTFDLTQS